MQTHPEQREHVFGDSYQGYELPDGTYVPGAKYAPNPRHVWSLQATQMRWKNAVGPWTGKRVLDLAGNNGYHGLRALREGAEAAFLVEQSPSSISKAREIAEAWGVPLTATQADIEKFPWKDWGPFDVIFCHQVLYHLRRPIPLLRRIRNALKPGGRLFTYTRIAYNVHEKHWEWVPNWETMRRTLYYVGFQGTHVGGSPRDLRMIHEPPSETLVGQCKVLVTASV